MLTSKSDTDEVRDKNSEKCPVCGRDAMLVKPIAIAFPGMPPWDKVVLCPEHGYVIIRMRVGK